MPIFSSPAFEDHEGLHAFHDGPAGLNCLIAIHSTALGPAGGGVRMWPYPDDQAAIDDALRLSRAMSHKNAMAGLELGGGKTVVIGDPARDKTPALFEALGRAIERLGGRYWAAEDVGVSPSDLVHARKETRFVAGLEGHPAASGDPSPVTAEGVRRGIALCVERALGRRLSEVTVAIQGVGHVGAILGLTYAPDFVVNGGGIINVAAEIRALAAGGAYDPAWVEMKVAAMIATLAEVLDRSAAERRPADQIAVQMAKERIAAARK
jgi:leucine dehydrogenase